MHYDIVKGENVLHTVGLREYGHSDVFLRLHFGDDSRVAEELLRMIGDYVISRKISLQSEETFGFGSWTVQFIVGDKGELWVNEYVLEGDRYVDGASFAMNLWKNQQIICEQNKVLCIRPTSTQLVVVSDGVLEGDPVEGVRYPSPGHMSGWWITTDRYNDDPKTLKSIHLMHVLRVRPELAEILALPFGFRFDKDGIIAFDQQVMIEIDKE